jgi:hypothetical protein
VEDWEKREIKWDRQSIELILFFNVPRTPRKNSCVSIILENRVFWCFWDVGQNWISLGLQELWSFILIMMECSVKYHVTNMLYFFKVSKDDVEMVRSLILTVIAVVSVMIVCFTCIMLAALVKMWVKFWTKAKTWLDVKRWNSFFLFNRYNTPEIHARQPQRGGFFSDYNSMALPRGSEDGSVVMRHYYEWIETFIDNIII